MALHRRDDAAVTEMQISFLDAKPRIDELGAPATVLRLYVFYATLPPASLSGLLAPPTAAPENDRFTLRRLHWAMPPAPDDAGTAAFVLIILYRKLTAFSVDEV